MNIRPIDMQVLIPRAADVSKAQNAGDQQTATQQQRLAENWQNISDIRQHQVSNLTKSEQGQVQSEQEKKERGKFKKRKIIPQKGTKEDNEENTGFADPLRGHSIDIKT